MVMLHERVLRLAREKYFLRQARAVLDTPPLVPRDDGVILFSMMGTRVLLPYLLAVKSLHAQLRRGRVVILDDGTLSAADKTVLARHLGDPRLLHIADVDTGDGPRGGTWERLLTLLDLRRDAYVIQLDSDTVTFGPVPEIAAAIDAGRSFTLRGDAVDSELLTLSAIAARTPADSHRDDPATHVQGAIESVMDQVTIDGREGLRYVRGCSGFAGFAPGGEGRALAEAFSREASRLLGAKRWAEWGSEQVTSNFVVANEPDPLLLPYGRYLNFWDEGLPADVRFVHFIGTYRYHRGAYAAAAVRTAAALRRETARAAA
jgi:hypothetical protein